jgi:hypothetical protein
MLFGCFKTTLLTGKPDITEIVVYFDWQFLTG